MPVNGSELYLGASFPTFFNLPCAEEERATASFTKKHPGEEYQMLVVEKRPEHKKMKIPGKT